MGHRQLMASACGKAISRARSNLRFQKARDISDAGGTFADALEATGLTTSGLRALLRDRLGSGAWPIREGTAG